jgi:hypothetical protein
MRQAALYRAELIRTGPTWFVQIRNGAEQANRTGTAQNGPNRRKRRRANLAETQKGAERRFLAILADFHRF